MDDKQKVSDYMDFRVLVENMSEEQADALMDVILQEVDAMNLTGNVAYTEKTEEEILAEE